MFTKRLVAVFVLFGTLTVVSTAARPGFGQEKNFFDRLDDFGRSIFDGILPAKKDRFNEQQNAAPNRQPSANWQDFSDPLDQTGTSRAGSVLTRETRPPREVTREDMIRPKTESEYTPPAVTRDDSGEPRRVRRPLAGDSLIDDYPAPIQSIREYPPQNQAADRPTARRESAVIPKLSEPVAKPLHKRLEDFRQSVFQSNVSRPSLPSSDLIPERYAAPSPPADLDADAPRPTGRPLIAQRTVAGSRFSEGLLDDEPRAVAESVPAKDAGFPAAAEPSGRPQTEAEQPAETNGVLIARKSPNLGVETLGPRTIMVGRESTYKVIVANSGDAAAEGLAVFVSLPDWAEVVAVEAGAGAAQPEQDERQVKIVRWKVGDLAAKDRAELSLKIVPRQPRPFYLEISWNYKPTASQAAIEVQEPKLALKLVGPNEVFYGKKELFQLILSNSGTGDADNVELTLVPIGAGENVRASHKVGVLKAGETKNLEVELTARQSGNLAIHVEARGDGNLKAELAENVLVRRGNLEIGVEGPKVQFVGAAAEYHVAVGNPGNAPARNLTLSLTLPDGAEYLSGIAGVQTAENGKRLVWRIGSLPAGEKLTFAVRCRMAKPGQGRVILDAVADDDLDARAETAAIVEAVADLTMSVKDPAGPIPIGEEVVYEVRVRNRGTETARGVEVFAYFSRGIEPVKAEGAESRLAPGQVIFQPIDSIGPDEEIVLKIRARAEAAGNHVFRAETHCKPLGARLISEATNRYYGNVPAERQMATRPSEDEATR